MHHDDVRRDVGARVVRKDICGIRDGRPRVEHARDLEGRVESVRLLGLAVRKLVGVDDVVHLFACGVRGSEHLLGRERICHVVSRRGNIGIRDEGVGTHRDFVAVRDAVAIRILIVRIGAVYYRFGNIAQAIAIGIESIVVIFRDGILENR